MREAYRLQKNNLQHNLQQESKTMSVFILYVGKELPAYELLYEKMGIALNRLIKLSHEQAEANS